MASLMSSMKKQRVLDARIKVCDGLKAYLEDLQKLHAGEQKQAAVQSKAVDHGGMQVLGKKNNDDDDESWGGLSKKKKKGKKKKGNAGPKTSVLQHPVVRLAAFSEVHIAPPADAAELADCLALLAGTRGKYEAGELEPEAVLEPEPQAAQPDAAAPTEFDATNANGFSGLGVVAAEQALAAGKQALAEAQQRMDGANSITSDKKRALKQKKAEEDLAAAQGTQLDAEAALVQAQSGIEDDPDVADFLNGIEEDGDSDNEGAVAGEANGYGTVAVDLAAEAKKAKEMKAKGLNPDGTPYIHLPGMDQPPPTAMKKNPITGEMEEFKSHKLQDDLPEVEAETAEVELPCGDDY